MGLREEKGTLSTALEKAYEELAEAKRTVAEASNLQQTQALEKEVARYANEKGNLLFPLDKPIPYKLIARIVKLRVKQDLAKAAAKLTKKR